MGTLRVIARNLSFSWLGHIVYAATSLILTPVILESLGEVRFGLWALVTGFTGYYGLLDMGIRPGLTRFITKYRALGDWNKLNQMASTGLAALSLCGGLLWLVTCLLTYLAPELFPIEGENATSLRWAVFLMGTSLSLQFPFFFQSAVFVATQRFDLINIISIASRLIQAVAIYFVVTAGFGLVGLAATVAVCEIGTYILRVFVALRLIPQLHFSLKHLSKTSLKDFFSFSAWATVSRFSTELNSTSDRYVVAFLLGASAVTRFQLAFTLVFQLRKLFSPVGQVFFPALADLSELDRTQELKALYLGGTRLVTLLIVPAVIIAGAWAPTFYELWIGPTAYSGKYPSAAMLTQLLLLGLLIQVPQTIGYQIFHAKFRLKELSSIKAAEALTNVIASILLGHYFGLTGVAVATLVAVVLFELILLPWRLSKVLAISLAFHYYTTWSRPLLVGVFYLPIIAILKTKVTVDSWGTLFVVYSLAGCAAIILILGLGLSSEERTRLVWMPLNRQFSSAKKPR